MKNGMVSIITALYNCESYILETMNSVRSQTYKKWELIIVDDCSNDRGLEIVKEFSKKDKRIKYIRLEVNSGAAIARNKGIELAEGEYIAFLDSDDIWMKDKLEKQINFMKKFNYSISFSEYEEINEKSETLGSLISCKKNSVNYRTYLLTNPIGLLTGIYSVKNLGKVYMPIIENREDTAFWLKILKKDNAYLLREVLAFYRIRKGSLSYKKLKLIKYHWNLYRDIEHLSVCESLFYVFTTICTKIFNIKKKKIRKGKI